MGIEDRDWYKEELRNREIAKQLTRLDNSSFLCTKCGGFAVNALTLWCSYCGWDNSITWSSQQDPQLDCCVNSDSSVIPQIPSPSSRPVKSLATQCSLVAPRIISIGFFVACFAGLGWLIWKIVSG